MDPKETNTDNLTFPKRENRWKKEGLFGLDKTSEEVTQTSYKNLRKGNLERSCTTRH